MFGGDLANKLGSRVEVLIVVNVELLLFSGNHFLGDVGVGALESQHDGLGEVMLLVGLNDGSSESVTSQDTTEDVNEDGLDLSVFVQQLHSNNESVTLS